jgi:pimeloyl-ACP methyl ester carboxylesterase
MSRGVIGHSAGGYLALWAANRQRAPKVDLVVGLAAVTDLEQLSQSDGAGRAPAQTLLDFGAPGQVEVGPVPALLVHGAEDGLVPPPPSDRLADGVRLEVVAGLGHFELLDPGQAHWEPIVRALSAATS